LLDKNILGHIKNQQNCIVGYIWYCLLNIKIMKKWQLSNWKRPYRYCKIRRINSCRSKARSKATEITQGTRALSHHYFYPHYTNSKCSNHFGEHIKSEKVQWCMTITEFLVTKSAQTVTGGLIKSLQIRVTRQECMGHWHLFWKTRIIQWNNIKWMIYCQ